jgi:ABC-type hemin transport system ATPase subunit
MNASEFRNVTLTLGGRAVLAGVSLKFAPRELVGVLGPNGAGKKDVAVPSKDLKVVSRDGKDWLVLNQTSLCENALI